VQRTRTHRALGHSSSSATSASAEGVESKARTSRGHQPRHHGALSTEGQWRRSTSVQTGQRTARVELAATALPGHTGVTVQRLALRGGRHAATLTRPGTTRHAATTTRHDATTTLHDGSCAIATRASAPRPRGGGARPQSRAAMRTTRAWMYATCAKTRFEELRAGCRCSVVICVVPVGTTLCVLQTYAYPHLDLDLDLYAHITLDWRLHSAAPQRSTE